MDCQAGVGLSGSTIGGGPAAAHHYHRALEDSVAMHFPGNHCINCMCHSTENLYRWDPHHLKSILWHTCHSHALFDVARLCWETRTAILLCTDTAEIVLYSAFDWASELLQTTVTGKTFFEDDGV